MSYSGYVEVDVALIVAETDKAFLLELDSFKLWVPKRCIADVDDYKEGDIDCQMSIREDFAAKNDLC